MNRNSVIAVVIIVVAVALGGLWAARRGGQTPGGLDCSTPPAVPTGVSYTKNGNLATLLWTAAPASDVVTTYVIEAGDAPGANNQGTFVALGTATSFQREAPPGKYFVRLFARNNCGTSAPSTDIVVTIP